MIRVEILIVFVIVLVWPVRFTLLRVHWTERAPRSALAFWQALGLALGVALLGACFELASSVPSGLAPRRHVTDFTSSRALAQAPTALTPHELFGLTAAIIIGALVLGSLATRAVGMSRSRARQRLLIDLIGSKDRVNVNVTVVEDPRATVFGLPGFRPRVVVSRGALDILSSDELVAALAHERAHLRWRHDLALLPFRALAAALPRCRSVRAVRDDATALLEMAADDRALRECEPVVLARALCALSTTEVSLDPRTEHVERISRRIERALSARRDGRWLACGLTLSTLGVLALPFVTLFAPIGAR